MQISRTILAAVLAAPLTFIAGESFAVPVSFSSNGSFANPTGCNAIAPACTVDQGGNRLILGTGTFFGIPIAPYSTLTAVDQGLVNTSTPQNNYKIGEIDWVNVPTSNTDSNFNAKFTLTLTFSAPGATVLTQTLDLNIQQPTNPPGDSITNLIIGASSPFNVSFGGLTISDVKFSLLGATGGSTYNATTGAWFNPESNTSRLQITADFTATPVPEPASLALIGTGLVGLGLGSSRRKRAAGPAQAAA